MNDLCTGGTSPFDLPTPESGGGVLYIQVSDPSDGAFGGVVIRFNSSSTEIFISGV